MSKIPSNIPQKLHAFINLSFCFWIIPYTFVTLFRYISLYTGRPAQKEKQISASHRTKT